MYRDYVLSLLEELCFENGTPGDETRAAEVSAEKLKEFMPVAIDRLGNVVGRNEAEGTHFLLDAHIDRIGFAVTAITDEGFIKVGSCGGVDVRTLDSAEVIIYGTKPVYGIITCTTNSDNQNFCGYVRIIVHNFKHGDSSFIMSQLQKN